MALKSRKSQNQNNGNFQPANKCCGANPLGLDLGESIRVKAVSYVDYTEQGKKEHFRHPIDAVVVVCGTCQKCTGQYEPEFRGYPPYYEDATSSRLKVENRIRFYICRRTIDGPELLIHPDDVVV